MSGEEPTRHWVVVTGLDGAGKTTLVGRLAERLAAKRFRLPYHAFVRDGMDISGGGSQTADSYTDRLLHIVDSRLTDQLIRGWLQAESLVSQRGWTDHFVFGAVQGYSYAAMAALLRPEDLVPASAYIHLVADPQVAYRRIADDPDGDKFETLSFMRRQARETRRLFQALRATRLEPALRSFAGSRHLLIDTSDLSPEAVFAKACEFLGELGLPQVAADPVPSPARA